MDYLCNLALGEESEGCIELLFAKYVGYMILAIYPLDK